MKRSIKWLAVLLVILLVCSLSVQASSNNFINAQIPKEVEEENHPTYTLKFKIYIENYENGNISIVDLQGKHTAFGVVYRPATLAATSSAGFWAAHYDKAIDGTYSCVTAIGTNALHLKVGPQADYDPLNPTAWMPRQLDIGIQEDYTHANGEYRDAMIYTSIPGGTNIFGGNCAPYVGNPVKYLDSNGNWDTLDNYYKGDYSKPVPKRLLIEVYEASTEHGTIDYIEFENWAAGDTINEFTAESNGRVLVHYQDGTEKYIADVIQRVKGTGRFGGSEYSEVGRIRANHPGVICFSTSPKVGFTHNTYLRGGFQFVPANHAKFLSNDLNQDSFIGRDQWGIIAYKGASADLLYDPNYIVDGHVTYDPVWEGVAPLFAEYITPRHIPGNEESSTRFVVSTDFGESWEDCPTLLGITTAEDSPVANWTNIRLYLCYPSW